MAKNKNMWGGRFTKPVDKGFFEFQKSIKYDYKLLEYDVYHSVIHITALNKAGILDDNECKKLKMALKSVLDQIEEKGVESFLTSSEIEGAEDVHTYLQRIIEKKLAPKDKELVDKLHSLRSRNDQIVFNEKFYCLDKSVAISSQLITLLESIIVLEEKYAKENFIGYTHTQRAQAVPFVSYLSAFFYMFNRDTERLQSYVHNLNIYIGAGALTGSSLTKENYNEAIKEFQIVKQPSNLKLVENAMDNVSDRDFIIEFLSAISIIQMHLSRLAEDIILYSTKEFNFIKLPEEFCTGSSLMPHKKNPDFLELVRGYTGMIYGNLMAILTTMKGLPLTYNRDMQLDKQPLFSSIEIVEKELTIMAQFIKGIELNNKVIKAILKKEKALYATELAEWLVVEKKVPFKKAHDIVGRLIILMEKKGENITNADLKGLHCSLTKKIIKEKMNVMHALMSKKTVTAEISNIENVKAKVITDNIVTSN